MTILCWQLDFGWNSNRLIIVAPVANGGIVWYTAQALGKLGWLDPNTGSTHEIALGQGSAPHGVIIGPDGAPWITDGGLNAIVRVDPLNKKVQVFPLPQNSSSNASFLKECDNCGDKNYNYEGFL
jgi:streptogramin lyase